MEKCNKCGNELTQIKGKVKIAVQLAEMPKSEGCGKYYVYWKGEIKYKHKCGFNGLCPECQTDSSGTANGTADSLKSKSYRYTQIQGDKVFDYEDVKEFIRKDWVFTCHLLWDLFRKWEIDEDVIEEEITKLSKGKDKLSGFGE